MLREDLVDESLIAHASPPGFFPKLLQHADIDTNRDELPRGLAERWAAHPAHGAQLCR